MEQERRCPRCERGVERISSIPPALQRVAEGHAFLCRDCAWSIATGQDDKQPGHSLEIQREPSGWRHYLAGEAVHCGTTLELYMGQGRWMTGRYECDLHVIKPLAKLVLYVPSDRYTKERDQFAREVLENECPTVDVLGELVLSTEARLRWPERKR